MIKKINVEQLKAGHYIHSFDCKWFNHPFLFNKKKISDKDTIKKIRKHGIKHVLIDTSKGLDFNDKPTKEQLIESFKSDLRSVVSTEQDFSFQTSYKKEISRALEIQNKTKGLIKRVYSEIKSGQDINLTDISNAVDNILNSITRNKDALISLITIKDKDEYTFMHSMNVGILTTAFCKALDMDKEEIKLLGTGAMLHDIGKIKIPTDLINKDNRLSHDEYVLMKKHVNFSRELLANTKGISEQAIEIAFQHHERNDGSGYPMGLKSDDISMGGKIVSIIDVYDALTSERSYNTVMDPNQALRNLFEWSPSHFQLDLTQKFIRFMGIHPVGTLVKLESGFLAIVVESGQANIMEPKVKLVYDTNRNMPIVPRSLDLSKGTGPMYKIRCSVNPEKYNINLHEYLKAGRMFS